MKFKAISDKQIRGLGFIENKNHQHPCFDEWIHNKCTSFGIGDFNGMGYLIEGIDWHTPISDYNDLKEIVRILTKK